MYRVKIYNPKGQEISGDIGFKSFAKAVSLFWEILAYKHNPNMDFVRIIKNNKLIREGIIKHEKR